MLEPGVRAKMRAAVLAEAASAAEERSRVKHRLRHPGVIAAVSALLVGVGATSATAVVLHQRTVAAAPAASARCYSEVSRDRGDGFLGSTVVIGYPGINSLSHQARIVDPVPLCSSLWQVGALPRTNSPIIDQTARARIPNLTACVDTDGVVSVFPAGSNVCVSLGLSIDTNSRPHVAN